MAVNTEHMVNMSGWMALLALALFLAVLAVDGKMFDLSGMEGVMCGFAVTAIFSMAAWVGIEMVAYERRKRPRWWTG